MSILLQETASDESGVACMLDARSPWLTGCPPASLYCCRR